MQGHWKTNRCSWRRIRHSKVV